MKQAAILATLALVGCATTPAAVAPVRAPTEVSASFGRAWDAVVDVFASRNIPIQNMDRSSGFISTPELAVDRAAGKAWADCGTIMGMGIPPDRANYNVRVRGDSTRSSVQVTVFWKMEPAAATTCTSRGVWEGGAETDIKARAESR